MSIYYNPKTDELYIGMFFSIIGKKQNKEVYYFLEGPNRFVHNVLATEWLQDYEYIGEL